MFVRLPRGFRPRTLFCILLIGSILLAICFYFPVSFRDSYVVRIKTGTKSPTDQSKWWSKWLFRTSKDCARAAATPKPSSGSIYTGDVYAAKLDFSVPDNGGLGFWNDELESRYRAIRETWKDMPLEVIVVPHSHVDPGWLNTYGDYFESSVVHILDNMVTFLNKTRDFKFIWSEMSFFSNWWDRQNADVQEIVKQLLKRKQLEIVTGGWVMTDEATTSYYSIIDQLIEGHQWLYHFTKVIPQRGWSVDVFGHSASMPYILSLSGITDSVILRTHYAWKAFLAKMRWFDFYWEQQFSSPRMFCHMAPSDLYSFKHVCGPDPFSCLNYDFRKIRGEISESTADVITDSNVELKANYLLAQYGRFGSLFNHSVLLVPLGDDFRFNVYSEWEEQYRNYKKLFSYINGKKELNARLRFGTVADYFEDVHRRLQKYPAESLPSLKGDFLPYGDIYANARPSYWTGFYTTRPFYKKLARELEHWIRSAEILFSLSKTLVNNEDRLILYKDYSTLISARQNLALFQHHDAITGTSKSYVMEDYGRKLHSGITNAMSIVSHVTQFLLMERISEGTTWTSQVYLDVYRSAWNKETKKLSLLTSDNGRQISFFNPLTVSRTEVIRLKVRTSQIKVLDSEGNCIPSQLNPTWKDGFVMSNMVFELTFVITVKPLSFSTYHIVKIFETDSNKLTKSVISLFMKDDQGNSLINSAFKFEKPRENDINLESPYIKAKFSPTGILKEIFNKDSGVSKLVNVDFQAYFPWMYRSGAYLFQPNYPDPTPLYNLTDHFPYLCVIRGPIVSEVNILYHNFFKSTIRVYHFEGAPAALELGISLDLAKLNKDIELIMRINSDIKNNGTFFTDSNGLQMLRRQFVDKLPLQGNYYPATSSVYIEDADMRLTFLLPHSHGVTSPTPGTIEIMLDRRMSTDDGRGMSEGVEDNQMISNTYWLIPESNNYENGEHSLSSESHLLSMRLQYPIITLITDDIEAKMKEPEFSFLSEPWNPDVHLVNLRTLPSTQNYSLPSNSSLLIIYERSNACNDFSFPDSIKQYKLASFSKTSVDRIIKTSLTGTRSFSEDDISTSSSISKLQAYNVTFR